LNCTVPTAAGVLVAVNVTRVPWATGEAGDVRSPVAVATAPVEVVTVRFTGGDVDGPKAAGLAGMNTAVSWCGPRASLDVDPSEAYAGKQIVGIDLHRRRSVVVRMAESGERLETVRISNDPEYLRQVMARAGEAPEVVLEATYGWYWAADALAELGAKVHLAHPLGVKAFSYRRVKNDERDAADLADLLRMGRLPEAWIAPPATRELRALVRHRAKLVALRSSVKCQVHAVLAGAGVQVPMSDLFGVAGQQLLQRVELPPACRARISSAIRVLESLNFEVEVFTNLITGRLRGHRGYTAIQAIPGVGAILGAVSSPRLGMCTASTGPRSWPARLG
jgi:transposase